MNAPPDQLAFHVKTYLPHAEGESLNLRTHLLKARDYAAALQGSLTGQKALEHARDAHELAGEMVFNPSVNAVHLKAGVDYCRALVKAAMLADLIEGGRE